jgi:pimeloyl-ACP methyl ester carboxylesterase
VVSWFHGTEIYRKEAPSAAGDFVGTYGSGVFAGNAYYAIAPDYIGFGVSDEVQAYLITKAQVDASTDLMRAVRKVAAEKKLPWNPDLFLIGFSQGGQTTAAVHRALERKPLAGYRVKASMGVAGAYDLRNIAYRNAVTTNCDNCAAYVALGTFAFSRYYGFALESALKPEYAKLVPELFDGSKTAFQVWPKLPRTVEVLLQPEFLKGMRENADIPFNLQLGENETWNWAPKAPFKIVYGDADKDVSPEDAKNFYAKAKARGGNVILHPAGNVDHEATGMVAIPHALNWFNSLAIGQ